MTPEALEREVKSLWGRFNELRRAGHVVIALREPRDGEFTLVGTPWRNAANDEQLLALLTPATTEEQIRVLITAQPTPLWRSA